MFFPFEYFAGSKLNMQRAAASRKVRETRDTITMTMESVFLECLSKMLLVAILIILTCAVYLKGGLVHCILYFIARPTS